MSAPEPVIGAATAAECDRDEIRALAFVNGVFRLADSETATEFRYRTEALADWARSIPLRYREKYADEMKMRWAWTRVRDDLRRAGVLPEPEHEGGDR